MQALAAAMQVEQMLRAEAGRTCRSTKSGACWMRCWPPEQPSCLPVAAPCDLGRACLD